MVAWAQTRFADADLSCWPRPDQGAPGTSYDEREKPLPVFTLDEIIKWVIAEQRSTDVDVVKMDCEHSENSSIDCAESATLRKIRYLVGEYHHLDRFRVVIEEKLLLTHRVNLIGERFLGAFFAEQKDQPEGLLLKETVPVANAPFPLKHHPFNESFVEENEWAVHGLLTSV